MIKFQISFLFHKEHQLQKDGHGGTATHSAPLTVLAVGGGAGDIYAPHTGGSAGDFSQGRRGGDGSQTISAVSYPEGASGGGGRSVTLRPFTNFSICWC